MRIPGDICPEIFRIWTDSHTSERLEDIEQWPYWRISRAIDWLDELARVENKQYTKGGK